MNCQNSTKKTSAFSLKENCTWQATVEKPSKDLLSLQLIWFDQIGAKTSKFLSEKDKKNIQQKRGIPGLKFFGIYGLYVKTKPPLGF